ncbi:HNH endonuclease [Bradyrhizobium cytisi]|uniref:HNH endonuclease n=1 Tax=Bradyrhizobium cytisi TaxID=515489 RepID=A0A5S4WCD9_9BRAD|nr:HNH endonuclease [Bradyrhizobium cytisi]TYL78559.1 HNH endonuclease [Bradyrhizobium cytisi]
MARPRYDDGLPSRTEIFEFWKDRIAGLVRWIDWGKPSCWACKFHYGLKYDIKRSDASWGEILRCWDRIPLQRCHIVGHSLGGGDDVANLFLMCRECHDRMPNTTIPEVFFEWARAQSWSAREDAKIRDAMQTFGVDDTTMPDLDQVLNSEDFKIWSGDKIGLHWPQSSYPSISSRLTPATILGLAIYYRRTFGKRTLERQCGR